MNSHLYNSVAQHLSQALNTDIRVQEIVNHGGSFFNQTGRVKTNEGLFFIKIQAHNRIPNFYAAEEDGLRTLSEYGTFRLPQCYGWGHNAHYDFLLLEYIDSAGAQKDFWQQFGQQLGTLHRQHGASFGYHQNNFIGGLPQSNQANDNWIDFFARERVTPLLEQTIERQLLQSHTRHQWDSIQQKLPGLFPEEAPALLHGDLWGGNLISDEKGQACLIDPAVYYGHREMELSFMLLFGGFDETCLDAYNEVYPLESDWRSRIDLCNLYPLLVHSLLFEGGYCDQAARVLDRFSD